MTQKIGFEVEFYSPLDRDAIKRRMNVHRISNFTLISDASLNSHTHDGVHYQGHEMIFTKPVSITHVGEKFDEAIKLLQDEKVHARNIDDVSRGSTGLHLHFGLEQGNRYGLLDFIRIMENTCAVEDRIPDISGRGLSRWARSLTPVKSELDALLTEMEMSYARREKRRAVKFKYPTCEGWDEARIKKFVADEFGKDYQRKLVLSLIGVEQSYELLKKFIQDSLGVTHEYLATNSMVQEWIAGNGVLRGHNVVLEGVKREGAKISAKWSISQGFNHEEIREFLDVSAMWKFKDGRFAMRPALSKWKTFGEYTNKFEKLFVQPFVYESKIGKKLMEMYKMNNGGHSEVISEYMKHPDIESATAKAINDELRKKTDAELSKGNMAINHEWKPNWFDCMRGFHTNNNRYYGVNATNIGYMDLEDKRKINTIEFRWASASLMESKEKFQSFFDFCRDLYERSFTGELVHQYGDYILKDITHFGGKAKHVLAVFKGGKMIGRLHCNNLDTRVLYPENTKFAHELKKASEIKQASTRKQLVATIMQHKEAQAKMRDEYRQAKKHLSKQKKQLALESIRTGSIAQLKKTVAKRKPQPASRVA